MRVVACAVGGMSTTGGQCQVAADGNKQLLVKVNELDLECEEQLWTGGRGTVHKDAAIAPQIVVGRAMCADSVQVQGSKRYPADAAGCSKQTVAELSWK